MDTQTLPHAPPTGARARQLRDDEGTRDPYYDLETAIAVRLGDDPDSVPEAIGEAVAAGVAKLAELQGDAFRPLTVLSRVVTHLIDRNDGTEVSRAMAYRVGAVRHPLDVLADAYHARVEGQPPGVQRSILIALFAAGLEQQIAEGTFDAGHGFDRLLDHFRAEESVHGEALGMWRAMTAALEALGDTPVASSGRLVPRETAPQADDEDRHPDAGQLCEQAFAARIEGLDAAGQRAVLREAFAAMADALLDHSADRGAWCAKEVFDRVLDAAVMSEDIAELEVDGALDAITAALGGKAIPAAASDDLEDEEEAIPHAFLRAIQTYDARAKGQPNEVVADLVLTGARAALAAACAMPGFQLGAEPVSLLGRLLDELGVLNMSDEDEATICDAVTRALGGEVPRG